jgi:ribosomal-protein-alanine N-acetyltransferase
MKLRHVADVGRVERECFTTPWPLSAYRREVRHNKNSRYIVLVWRDGYVEPVEAASIYGTPGRPNTGHPVNKGLAGAVHWLFRPFGDVDEPKTPEPHGLVGFAGIWLIANEAHVTTIGVRESLRGRGLGELLFASLIDISMQLKTRRVTLEVRVSNEGAQKLYHKYGFTKQGVRKKYYSDDKEDAAIMWSGDLTDAEYRDSLRSNMTQLTARLRGIALTPWFFREYLDQLSVRPDIAESGGAVDSRATS